MPVMPAPSGRIRWSYMMKQYRSTFWKGSSTMIASNQTKRCRTSRVWKLLQLFGMVLALSAAVGCWEGVEEDNQSGTDWELSMQYHYIYYTSGDNAGMLYREEDDNNADGIVDEHFVYLYEEDPIDTGERRLARYNYFIGDVGGSPIEAVGYYIYDTGSGDLIRLEHDPVGSGAEETWIYTYDNGRLESFIHYIDRSVQDTGRYRYNDNGDIEELDTLYGTWYYDLNDNGDRLAYEYFEDGKMVRRGTYVYDQDDRLIRLDHFEPL